MKATDIIAKKRGTFVRGEDGTKKIAQGTALTREEIAFMVSGYVAGTICFVCPVIAKPVLAMSFAKVSGVRSVR